MPGSSDFLRIWLGGNDAPVDIKYKIDPSWIKGDVPRSLLGADFGYLRGMVTLYTPYTLSDVTAMLQRRDLGGDQAGMAELSFDLPAGWNCLLPWDDLQAVPLAELRNVYLPVGPLSAEDSSFGQARFVLAQEASLSSETRQSMSRLLPALFAEAQANLGIAPSNLADRFVVSILPEDPIHGGAAGISSLICSPEPETLAHEMFHWWNGHTLVWRSDAEWIHEGFTVY
jgi:hypothetical protein